jgi:toxin ParE1/3/4
MTAIQAALDGLLAFPAAGAPRDQLAQGLRMKPYGSYAIYYFADARDLTVVRVLHGARDAAAIADRGEFGR